MIARLALAFCALLLCASPALAYDTYERITDYNSDITIARNGALTVIETIKIVVADNEIHHGIFRDFPTSYTDKQDNRVHVDFSVLSVTRDGHPEPYDVDSIDDGQRIKIGDPDHELDPGVYTYAITYMTDRQIGFFDKYDELYWNVTGNFWKFPIERAEATIHLPPGAHIIQDAFYTGAEGSTATNAKADVVSDDTIHFATTEGLAAQEGLTVAVGFNKGIIPPPTPEEKRANFIRDNGSLIAALTGFAILLVYFGATWFEFGRDPRRGTIVPLFAPPDGLSPAAVSYIHRMKYDRKAYAATLVDLAVKGYATISQENSTYTLTRTGKSVGDCGLAPVEATVANALFDEDNPNDSIVMKQENHSQISSSIAALQKSLKNQYETNYFITNSHWFFGGLAILALTTVAAALLSESSGASFGILFWLSGWSVGTAFIVHRAWDQWVDVVEVEGVGTRILNGMGAIFTTAFALPFVGGWFFGAYMVSKGTTPMTGVVLIAAGITTFVFYHLLKAPTLAGAKARDQIDGFKLFLTMTEKDRLEVLNPPNVTPALFEKFLPYAIALECENSWSKKFDAEAAQAGMTPDSNGVYFMPLWYSGSGFGSLGAAGFASGLGASLASEAASASSAPGSSSGSGGGGFSGGGGGGGGGGGW
ncbi:MAG TPA: DUF2207 domain-containing protein [Rhizomicrobium sp.]